MTTAAAQRPSRFAFLMRAGFLLPAALLAMEICWVFPWLVWITGLPKMPWQHPPLSLLGSLIVMTGAYAAARATEAPKTTNRKRAIWIVGALVLFAVVLRAEHGGGVPVLDVTGWLGYSKRHLTQVLFAYLYGFYLLWRGSAVGRDLINFGRLYRSFTFGLGALAVLLVIWALNAAAGMKAPGGLVSLMVATFFFAGLSGLALSNFMAMQEEAMRLGKRAQDLSGRWLSLFLLLALGTALLGFILASVVSVDIITLLRTPLVWAANGIGLILVYVIGYPLGYVAALGVFVLRWFLALINKDGTAPTIQLPQRPDLEKIAREPKDAGFWGDLLVFGKWAVLIGLLALCVYLLVRYLMRKRDRQTAAEFEETSESIFNRDQFWKDVLAFWRGLFSRFKRPIPARGRAGAGRPADHADDGRTLSMREIYGALLVEGERAGTPREEAETPHEYARRLAGANGAAGPDLETITEGYVRERYGSLPTPTERVPFLNQVWRRVRGLIGSPGMREP